MALNKTALKAAVNARLTAIDPVSGQPHFNLASQFTKINVLVDAILEEVIDHIIANAETKTQVGTTVTMPTGSIIVDPITHTTLVPSTGSGSETDAPGTII